MNTKNAIAAAMPTHPARENVSTNATMPRTKPARARLRKRGGAVTASAYANGT